MKKRLSKEYLLKKAENEGFLVYYDNTNGNYEVYDSLTNKIESVQNVPFDRCRFFVFNDDKYKTEYKDEKGKIKFQCSHEGLRSFVKDFNIWCDELANNDIAEIIYKTYFTHGGAVVNTFKRYAGKLYNNHDPIDAIEGKWIEACPNGGQMYCDPQTCESFGYDYKNSHARVMASRDIRIPTKRGKEVFLTSIDNKDQGYYRVKITSNNPDAKKVFTFSKHDTYTYLSLHFAVKYQELLNFNMELIIDDKPNAYIYENNDKQHKNNLVDGIKIFGAWFEKMDALKLKFPKNKLVKTLCSSLWGQLSAKKMKNYSEVEIEEKDMYKEMSHKYNAKYHIVNHVIKNNGNNYYTLVDPKEYYKHNIRLKPFLMARTRYAIGMVAMLHLDCVVRVQTDNVVFTKQFDDVLTAYPRLGVIVPEAKTTGLITWKNVNYYDQFIDEFNEDVIS